MKLLLRIHIPGYSEDLIIPVTSVRRLVVGLKRSESSTVLNPIYRPGLGTPGPIVPERGPISGVPSLNLDGLRVEFDPDSKSFRL